MATAIKEKLFVKLYRNFIFFMFSNPFPEEVLKLWLQIIWFWFCACFELFHCLSFFSFMPLLVFPLIWISFFHLVSIIRLILAQLDPNAARPWATAQTQILLFLKQQKDFGSHWAFQKHWTPCSETFRQTHCFIKTDFPLSPSLSPIHSSFFLTINHKQHP